MRNNSKILVNGGPAVTLYWSTVSSLVLYLNVFTIYTWQIQVCRQSVFQCGAPIGGSIVVDQPELSHKRAYTRIGLYRGNIVAIKLVYKRNIDITRNIRKELKQVSCMCYIVYICVPTFFNFQVNFMPKCAH